jgi:hypothetical protein
MAQELENRLKELERERDRAREEAAAYKAELERQAKERWIISQSRSNFCDGKKGYVSYTARPRNDTDDRTIVYLTNLPTTWTITSRTIEVFSTVEGCVPNIS